MREAITWTNSWDLMDSLMIENMVGYVCEMYAGDPNHCMPPLHPRMIVGPWGVLGDVMNFTVALFPLTTMLQFVCNNGTLITILTRSMLMDSQSMDTLSST